ncbi:MAG TPA: hypothetical protein VK826_02220 [Bacteroidia bacterium]|nr:hypothetical protein [Bacteroidia bacterium]
MSLRSRYRLSRFGNRLQLFFLGFLLGIVLGGGFFLLKLDGFVKEFALEKTFSDPGEDKDSDVPETDKTDKPVKPRKTGMTDNVEYSTGSDSSDVSMTDDSTTQITDGSDEIVVRKDELLAEKVVLLVNLDGTNVIDSIRSREAGIKEDPGKSVTVEFWQSPLNYKGYKLSRSRLVLFGFEAEEQFSLYRLDNVMFMKTSGGVFRLENTADFRQLERVTDEALLAKLP